MMGPPVSDMAPVSLRPLRLRDAAFCMRLARDPVVRRVSFTKTPPTWRQHARWMWRWAGPGRRRRAWVVTIRGRRMGLVRYGPDRYLGDRADEAHVALTALARNMGYGQTALWLLRHRHARHDGDRPLHAYIHEDNVRAQRAFTAAGYSDTGSAGDGHVLHVALPFKHP